MNNLQLINSALQLIGVLPEGQDANAAQGALALTTVNEIAEEWAEDGVVMPWSANAQLADDCPLTGMEVSAVRYALAVRLCPYYGREPATALAIMAGAAWQKLLRREIANELEAPKLPMPISQDRAPLWDINRGQMFGPR